jgi:signal transduction histidine kinase
VATTVALAVLWLLVTRLTRPLVELADAAADIAAGDYHRRVTVGGRQGEVARLALAFNRMAEHIEDSYRSLEERVVQRTAELTAATEELEAFAYSVSHDLRAPLRAIDGFSQALIEDCGPRLEDQERGHLLRVRRASQRMATLIDELLRLSRVTRAPLERRPVNLSELATEILDELQLTEPERQVEVAIAPDLWVEGDAALLRALLENVLGNAWKFTARRADARIEMSINGNESEPVVSIRDNGAGFDMSFADKLFTPFRRLHKTSDFEGNGVGLATVRRIVHRHGGRVWAVGSVGGGATISFSVGGAAAGGGENCG